MANEATCIVAPKLIVTRNCVDTIAIPKGTLLKLSGTNFVASTALSGAAFGGISVEEKTANDGVTIIGCALDGVWDIKNSCAATLACGTMVSMSGTNVYGAGYASELLTGAIMGKLEEIGTNTGTDRVRLRGY
jgi:hypothetical protein